MNTTPALLPAASSPSASASPRAALRTGALLSLSLAATFGPTGRDAARADTASVGELLSLLQQLHRVLA